MHFALHGWGSSAKAFTRHWPTQCQCTQSWCFMDGDEEEALYGGRRWFPFTGRDTALGEAIRTRADGLEARIKEELRLRSLGLDVPICMLGHSQGGMLALELGLRSRLNIVAVDVFGAFIPSSAFHSEGSCQRSLGIRLWAGEQDRYVPLAKVRATANALMGLGYANVELVVVPRVLHEFSSGWLKDWRPLVS